MPAISSPYDDAFVDQLEPFLRNVREAGFAGGEPFLIPIHYRIWDRVAGCNPNMIVMIVTNGTTLNDRVRLIADRLNCVINVSVDSIVKETYESIRQGASLETVLENSRYFSEVMQKKGFPPPPQNLWVATQQPERF